MNEIDYKATSCNYCLILGSCNECNKPLAKEVGSSLIQDYEYSVNQTNVLFKGSKNETNNVPYSY